MSITVIKDPSPTSRTTIELRSALAPAKRNDQSPLNEPLISQRFQVKYFSTQRISGPSCSMPPIGQEWSEVEQTIAGGGESIAPCTWQTAADSPPRFNMISRMVAVGKLGAGGCGMRVLPIPAFRNLQMQFTFGTTDIPKKIAFGHCRYIINDPG
jgi:hypothetical protein